VASRASSSEVSTTWLIAAWSAGGTCEKAMAKTAASPTASWRTTVAFARTVRPVDSRTRTSSPCLAPAGTRPTRSAPTPERFSTRWLPSSLPLRSNTTSRTPAGARSVTDEVRSGPRHDRDQALINSWGVNRNAMVPSRQGRSSRNSTRPSSSSENRSVATGGQARYGAIRPSPARSLAARRVAA
jgi:hypothetical protein